MIGPALSDDGVDDGVTLARLAGVARVVGEAVGDFAGPPATAAAIINHSSVRET